MENVEWIMHFSVSCNIMNDVGILKWQNAVLKKCHNCDVCNCLVYVQVMARYFFFFYYKEAECE